MKVGDHILVYGTLKDGHGAFNSFMRGRCEFVGEDRVNGKMYSLGGFPGFKAVAEAGARFHPDEPAITGEVYVITDDQLPTMLDNYEGYPTYYGRKQYATEGGLKVWVYDFKPDVHDTLYIKTGVWEGHHRVSA